MVHLLRCFGAQKFPIKKLLSSAEMAISSKQQAVRQATLGLYEECFKWIGDAISPAVQKLNKPQQDELDKLFSKVGESSSGKPVPTRATVKEAEQIKQAQINEICEKEDEELKQQEEILDLEEEKD